VNQENAFAESGTSPTHMNADLAVCPAEVLALDPNAAVLWVKFLRRTGVPMSAKSKKGKNAATDMWVDNNSRRAFVIRSFGVPSLVQRLMATTSEIQRARVWWRESAACAEGESVPDLSSENLAVLNPFIVTRELKFKDTRFEKLTKPEWLSAAPATDTSRARNTHKRIQQARQGRKASPMAKIAAVGN
jgi:hypothetical protein